MGSRARHAASFLTAALAAAPLALVPGTAARAAAPGTIVLERDGGARTIAFTADRAGEAVLGFTAAAPGVSWGRAGAESAVVAVAVDGRHVTDVVVPSSDPVPRGFGLGHVEEGPHEVTLRFADASAAAARSVALAAPRVAVPEAGQLALRHAPVIVGRTGWPFGDPRQNARTDAPLVAWHETRPAATAGHRVIEYSLVWSNEDGGTDTPGLLARWGRTSDIEWTYRVEVDASGARVPGTAVYHGPFHVTLNFAGRYERDHPVLQTCTQNNNLCDVVSPGAPLRFLPDASRTRPDGRAREAVMDREPWTYRVMAQELVREGKVEAPSDPATPEAGDPRAYLFVEFAMDVGAGTAIGSAPGLALGVRLKGDPSVLYRSDHGRADRTIGRDGAVATAVELPPGTRTSDIASVKAVRRPTGLGDDRAPITVTAIHRAFMLDDAFLPGPSALTWDGAVALTPAEPSAVLWRG
ncbi:hypothetical protein [Actinomadura rifamycini]|uniref:hypothetical protein n=1 Tax=Actinomadura rifamycini TaxID=31962 RepID=UPI00047A8A56|nr:hypothetical protein [Actinomadura rifamycini]